MPTNETWSNDNPVLANASTTFEEVREHLTVELEAMAERLQELSMGRMTMDIEVVQQPVRYNADNGLRNTKNWYEGWAANNHMPDSFIDYW